MVFIKHNSLKSDIFFNPIFFQVFQGSAFSRSRFFRVRVQGPGPGFRSSHPKKLTDAIDNTNVICKIVEVLVVEIGSVGCSVPEKQSPAAVL